MNTNTKSEVQSLILILMMADRLRIDTGAVNGNGYGNGRLRRMWVTWW